MIVIYLKLNNTTIQVCFYQLVKCELFFVLNCQDIILVQ